MSDLVLSMALKLEDGEFRGNLRLDKEALDAFAAGGEKAATGARAAGDATERAATQHRRHRQEVDAGEVALRRLTQAAAGYLAADQLQRLTMGVDRFQMLKDRIDSATDSTFEFSQVYQGLRGVANATGSALDANVALFQRLEMSAQDLAATNEEMLQFTATVQQLGVIGGASGEALRAGTLQLGQALSANVVRAEEWNSIMENIPAIGERIAGAMGMTAGQLRLAVLEGRVLSEEVFEAILDVAPQVAEEFEDIPMRLGRATVMLRTNLMDYIASADEAYGLTTGLAEAIAGLAQNVDVAAQGVEGLVLALGAGGLVVAGNAAGIALASASAAGLGLAAAINTITAAIAANPVGALAVGVAALTTALWAAKDVTIAFGEDTEELTSAMTTIGEVGYAAWMSVGTALDTVWKLLLNLHRPFDFVAEQLRAIGDLWDDAFASPAERAIKTSGQLLADMLEPLDTNSGLGIEEILARVGSRATEFYEILDRSRGISVSLAAEQSNVVASVGRMDEVLARYWDKRAAEDAYGEQAWKDYAAAIKNVAAAGGEALKDLQDDMPSMAEMLSWTPEDLRNFIRRTEEAADEIKAINDEAARDGFRVWREGWRSMLDGNLEDFEDFADKLNDVAIDWASNHLAKETSKWMNDALTAGFGEEGAKQVKSIVATVAAVANLASGIFGPRPSDRIEGVTRGLYTGERWESDLGPNKDSPENRERANALDDALMNFIGTLETFGVNTQASGYMLEVGSGNSLAPFRASVSGGAIQSFQSEQDAFAWVAEQLVADIGEVPAQIQALVDNFDGSNIEAFFAEMQGFADATAAMRDVQDQILQLTDPEAYDFAMLDREFEARRANAIKWGLDLTQIEELYALRRQKIVEKWAEDVEEILTDAANDNTAAIERTANLLDEIADANIRATQDMISSWDEVATAADRNAQTLRGAAHDLRFDPRRSSSAERLATLTPMFDELVAQLLENPDLEGGGAQLKDLGDRMLEAAERAYGTTGGFQSIADHIEDGYSRAAVKAQSQLDVALSQLSVLEASLAELRGINSGRATGSAATGGVSSGDWDALSAQFAGALDDARGAGKTDAQFLGSAQYGVFRDAFDSLVGRTTDQNYLQETLKFAVENAGDAVWGNSHSRNAGVLRARITALGGAPRYARGGNHPGGGRFVGEEGVEFETTGPARIYSAQDTKQMMQSAMADNASLNHQMGQMVGLMQTMVARQGDMTAAVNTLREVVAEQSRRIAAQDRELQELRLGRRAS